MQEWNQEGQMEAPEGCEWSSRESFDDALAASMPQLPHARAIGSNGAAARDTAANGGSAEAPGQVALAGSDRNGASATVAEPARAGASVPSERAGSAAALGTAAPPCGETDLRGNSAAVGPAELVPGSVPASAATAAATDEAAPRVASASEAPNSGKATVLLDATPPSAPAAIGAPEHSIAPSTIAARASASADKPVPSLKPAVGAWKSARGAASVFNMPHLTRGETLLALDCEMCTTENGFEVTRISLVDSAGQVRDPAACEPIM